MKLSNNPVAGFIPCPKCQQAALVHFPKGGARRNSPYIACLEHGSQQNIPKAYFIEKAVTSLPAYTDLHGDSESAAKLSELLRTGQLTMDASQLSRLEPQEPEEVSTQHDETDLIEGEFIPAVTPLEEESLDMGRIQVTVDQDGNEVIPTLITETGDDNTSESSAGATALYWILGIAAFGGALFGAKRLYDRMTNKKAREGVL